MTPIRSFRVAALLLCASLPALAQSAAPREPHVALWLQPLPSIYVGASAGALYLSGGAQVSLTDRFDLALELDGLRFRVVDPSDQSFTAALSFVVRPFGGRRLTGFFLAPKVGGGVAWHRYEDASFHSGMLYVGLDLGWQFVWGPVFFAPVFGVAYIPYLSHSAVLPITFNALPIGHPRFALNLHLLRVGFAF